MREVGWNAQLGDTAGSLYSSQACRPVWVVGSVGAFLRGRRARTHADVRTRTRFGRTRCGSAWVADAHRQQLARTVGAEALCRGRVHDAVPVDLPLPMGQTATKLCDQLSGF
jgi:hypothetical protein